MLKKGAYGALMDEEDEGSKFCEEDIDQILQRRTQTITIQSEGKGSTFAKVETLNLLLFQRLFCNKIFEIFWHRDQTKHWYLGASVEAFGLIKHLAKPSQHQAEPL